MDTYGRVVVAVLSLLVAGYVILLTVWEQLSERWCLLWLGTCAVAIGLAASPRLLSWATTAAGAKYPVSALTLVAIFLLLVLAIHANSEATIQAKRVVSVTQQLALVRRALEQHQGLPDHCPGEESQLPNEEQS